MRKWCLPDNIVHSDNHRVLLHLSAVAPALVIGKSNLASTQGRGLDHKIGSPPSPN
jgi:hypothetical protein